MNVYRRWMNKRPMYNNTVRGLIWDATWTLTKAFLPVSLSIIVLMIWLFVT
jgi:hypothetical protein